MELEDLLEACDSKREEDLDEGDRSSPGIEEEDLKSVAEALTASILAKQRSSKKSVLPKTASQVLSEGLDDDADADAADWNLPQEGSIPSEWVAFALKATNELRLSSDPVCDSWDSIPAAQMGHMEAEPDFRKGVHTPAEVILAYGENRPTHYMADLRLLTGAVPQSACCRLAL